MESHIIGFIGFGALLVLIAMGVPIAFASALVGSIGFIVIGGTDMALHFLGTLPYSEVNAYAYTTLPLYILLGELAFHGGYANGAYRTAKEWFGRLPGGLCIATIFGGAGFGTVCGASVASSAVLGKICIPEMKKNGYDASLSAGTVASCANLSSMIPPSGLMIVYSIFTNVSLGSLFLAGILPGLLLALLFSAMIISRVLLNPQLAPVVATVPWLKKIYSVRHSWAILLIATVVIGGIYSGLFTATEAGGAGAFTAFIIAFSQHSLCWGDLKKVLLSSVRTTVMVLFVVVGILIFTTFLTLARVPIVISSALTGLSVGPISLICLVALLYLFLGMFFDAISMIALTVPVLYPSITAAGFDPVWFGVFVVLMCEIGLITPPVGINCFVVAGVAPDVPITKIFKGVVPFVLVTLLMAGLLIIFPQIALFLINT